MVLKATNLEIKFRLVFYGTSTRIISNKKKFSLAQKRGNMHTRINSHILKPLFLDILGSFSNWGSTGTITHLLHGFTPIITCPIKKSDKKCLEYVVFECCAKFKVNWESLAHRAAKKHVLGYVAPKPQRWQMSSFGLWIASIVTQLRTNSHIWINLKITNFVESNHPHGMIYKTWTWTKGVIQTAKKPSNYTKYDI